MSRPAHPWHTLIEAALAYAEAETDDEFRRATHRLRSAAKRFRDTERHAGRPTREQAETHRRRAEGTEA